MTSLREKLSYANVVATIALVLAVAGIPTAAAITASKVKKNAVGTKQLKNGSITPAKLAKGAVTTPKIAMGAVGSAQLAPTHQVNASADGTQPGGTEAHAICAAGERVLGGGGFSATGLTVSVPNDVIPQGGTNFIGWKAGGSTTGVNTASAVCLAP
jgi:hypothetical protein